jgi:hypothetical protein
MLHLTGLCYISVTVHKVNESRNTGAGRFDVTRISMPQWFVGSFKGYGLFVDARAGICHV